MLGKLLKYEIPAVGRKLGPLFIAWAATSILLGITLRHVESKSEIIMVLTSLLYAGVTIAVAVMTLVLIIQRYSNSLFGDEAYFNMALPVTSTEHIANKTISALIWTAAATVAAIASALLIGFFGIGITEIVKIDWMPLKQILQAITVQHVIVFIEGVLLYILSIVKSTLAIYAAITIGHQAKQRTTLASIGAYIGLGMVESTVGSIIGPRLSFSSSGYLWFGQSQAFMLSVFITVLALAAVYFLLCRYFLEKHLNLS